MSESVSIAIVGAGPVGLALAALCVKAGLDGERILTIDAKTVEQAALDPRTIALSWGSRQLLQQINAWPVAHDPIREIHVSRKGQFGRTLIDSESAGVPELGAVCRYGPLVRKLAQAHDAAGVRSRRPARVVNAIEADGGIRLELDDGSTVHADIVVQAEGGLFSEQQGKQTQRDYGQTAIVSHVAVAQPQPGRAWERFTDEGPLALLPQEGGYALVWCVAPERAEQLNTLDDPSFLAALQTAFGHRMGHFTAVASRHLFPLGLNADPKRTARTIAIGNAAQTLHPVAGQGLNLGLRDAAVLAKCLARSVSPEAIEAFSQQRRRDRQTTITLTDWMARIFAVGGSHDPLQPLLGAALGAMDVMTPAKRLLAEQMMYGAR